MYTQGDMMSRKNIFPLLFEKKFYRKILSYCLDLIYGRKICTVLCFTLLFWKMCAWSNLLLPLLSIFLSVPP